MEIVWSPHALERIEEISDFIAEDSLTQARKFIDKLIKSVERLQKYPLSGQVTPENPVFRQIVVNGYRLIYRPTDKEIQVITVVSPRLSNLLK